MRQGTVIGPRWMPISGNVEPSASIINGAEVVEDFQGAGLNSLGAGPIETAGGPIDDTNADSASSEVDA
jgi:hypothetical protein